MFGWYSQKAPGFQRLFGIPFAYEVSVGAMIFRRTPMDGEVEYLLLQYPHGHWDCVKGHIEAGETKEETLHRETLEEAGIREITLVKGFRSLTRYFYTAKGTELEKRRRSKKGVWILKTVYFYLAEAKDDTVTLSDEHIGFAWLPFEEAKKKLSFPAVKKILSDAHKFLAPQ
jgi:8-oxo-dGTP pyrophosphatase MutT (NUDIX family)